MMSAMSSVSSQTLDEASTHVYYHRYQSAIAALKSLLQKGDHSPYVYYWLGESYLKQGYSDSAAIYFQEGVRLFEVNHLSKKEYPLVFIGEAHLLLEKGDKENARKQMEEMLQLRKYKDPVALLAAARSHINSKNGDVVWALEMLDRAADKDRKNPDIYMAMGDAYRKQINGSKAVVSYNQALALNPSLAEAYYKKGLIYKSQNNTEVFVERFTEAVKADSLYAPALYELYYYYFYKDLNKAGELLARYLRNADPSIENEYMQTDYLYITRKYPEAIEKANRIISMTGIESKPRLYKLLAYSKAALGDSMQAEESMNKYFKYQDPAECISKDYELMAKLSEANYADKSRSLKWYKEALQTESDQDARLGYMQYLAEIEKELGNRDQEAFWREGIYHSRERPTNLDVYHWGVSLYMAANYQRADSVFGIYSEKYPDQIYGYLWQARCNAIMDSTMEKGLAVTFYTKLLDVIGPDLKKNKATVIKAYGYLGAYEANIRKDYPASLVYFEKLLMLDPENSDAQKYAGVLQKWIDNGSNTEPEENNKP